ncbi:anthranilate synthase component 1 [Psychrobacter sp. HD31]|uniref:anthranilate synthase component 1 n=1 Tax=Psychrobacter sp. HD31 TaxID=3112003 RepID=UPI003DA4F3A5
MLKDKTTVFFDKKSQGVPYSADLTRVFASICEGKSNTLLLESAEIESRNSLTSLLFVNSALRIVCDEQTVTFIALNQNGNALLPSIQQALIDKAESIELASLDNCDTDTPANDRKQLIATFASIDNRLDEDSKLHAPTVFDGLRVIQTLFNKANANEVVYTGGLFAYDVVRGFIPMQGITLEDDGITCPDYSFYLADQLLISDHENQQSVLHSFHFSAEPSVQAEVTQQSNTIVQQLSQPLKDLTITPVPTGVSENYADEEFIDIITRLKTHIYNGDVFQIVPSRRFSLACPSPLATYHQLKQNNPSPYMFYMQDEAFTLFGASPESSLKYTQDNRKLEVYPIAGSRPRGFDSNGNIDPELDARMELDLRLDKKELAEHLMLVDLARNDIARVCDSGTRQLDKLMQVDRYSHIMHLVSRVTGKLQADLDALHAYQACMNMGTLTGAPKIKAMQLIYQQEKQKRHSYGGAVGYFTSNGDLDTCIVIRSAFVQNDIAHIQAGCGEVLDSDPQLEADETRHKAAAVIKAIVQTHQDNSHHQRKQNQPINEAQDKEQNNG